jgi:hypothetical protein
VQVRDRSTLVSASECPEARKEGNATTTLCVLLNVDEIATVDLRKAQDRSIRGGNDAEGRHYNDSAL